MSYLLKYPFIPDFYEGEAPVNWGAMHKKPFRAILKASGKFLDGVIREDHQVENYVSQTKALEILDILYNFLRPNDIDAQANQFIETANRLGFSHTIAILDVEIALPDNIGNAVWVKQVKQWLDKVEAATGIKPIIYTNKNYWNYMLVNGVPPSWMNDYYFIIAWYPYFPDDWGIPPMSLWPVGLKKENIAGWQYAEHGRTDGYIVVAEDNSLVTEYLANDLSVFYDWFVQYLGGVVPTPPPTPSGGTDMQYKVVWINGARKRIGPSAFDLAVPEPSVIPFDTVVNVIEVVPDRTEPLNINKRWAKLAENVYAATDYPDNLGTPQRRMELVASTPPPPSGVTLKHTIKTYSDGSYQVDDGPVTP